jgi:transposase
MKQKIEKLRKKTIKLLLSGKPVKEICEIVGLSRQWVYKWYKRYLKGDKLWFKEHSRAPYNIPHKTPSEIEQAVISIRKRLQQKDGFKGAQRIRWEMEDLNYEYIPSISTINTILKRNNLIEHNEKRFNPKGKNYPSIKCERPNELHEVDLLGPRYLKGVIRFYLLNVIDIFSHRVGIEILQSKYDEIIAEALIRIWKRLGLPQYLQLDNQSPFRGSDRHPRSFGIVIKLCLSLNIQPVFIPLNEPWRNGCALDHNFCP